MLSDRVVVILTIVMSCFITSCRQSPSEKLVGIWQFSGMDATMDYVFKADHTFEVWAPPMDVERSKGPWLRMDFGDWKIEGDEIVVDSRRPPSEWLKDAVPETKEESDLLRAMTQRLDRWRVLRFGADKIEFQQGGPLIRATSRRGI